MQVDLTIEKLFTARCMSTWVEVLADSGNVKLCYGNVFIHSGKLSDVVGERAWSRRQCVFSLRQFAGRRR